MSQYAVSIRLDSLWIKPNLLLLLLHLVGGWWGVLFCFVFTYGVQKKVWDILGLELQVAVSWYLGSGDWNQVHWKSSPCSYPPTALQPGFCFSTQSQIYMLYRFPGNGTIRLLSLRNKSTWTGAAGIAQRFHLMLLQVPFPALIQNSSQPLEVQLQSNLTPLCFVDTHTSGHTYPLHTHTHT